MQQVLQLVISLTSGEQHVFTDEFGGMTFGIDYGVKITDSLRDGERDGERDYDKVITIRSSYTENAYQSYKNFEEFALSHLTNLTKEELSNIVIKDNYGNVYYNLLQNEISELEIKGSNTITPNNGMLVFSLIIWCKGE